MSQTVAGTLPIGTVQAYWNGVRMGSPGSQATVRYNKDTINFGLQDAPVFAGSYKTRETVEVDVMIADLRPEQLRYVYDQAKAVDDRGTLKSSVFVDSSATVLFFKEDLAMSGTAEMTLAQAGIAETSTVQVLSTELTPYTQGTDWSITNAAAGRIKALGGGSINAVAETVIVHYKQSATSDTVMLGGIFFGLEGELILVHICDNGKLLQFKAPRARHTGASDIAVQAAAAFGGIPMTFTCLADHALPPGKQLCQWGKQD